MVIGIVLIEGHIKTRKLAGLADDALSKLIKLGKLEDGEGLGRRILRMTVIIVEASSVWQDTVCAEFNRVFMLSPNIILGIVRID